MTLSDALREVDAILDRFAALDLAPGVAYGVVVDGDLVLELTIETPDGPLSAVAFVPAPQVMPSHAE